MLSCFTRDFQAILDKDEISQDVVFIHEKTEYPLKAVFQSQEFNEKQSEGRVMLDSVTCFAFLPDEPKIYDIIKTDDMEYKIINWEKQVSRYKLILEKEKRSTNAHTQGRYR